MNPTRTTPPSHPAAATPGRSRRPGHPTSVPPQGPRAAMPAGPASTATEPAPAPGADPVDRLEGIRVRLTALLPLLQDEPSRRLAAVLREVEALAGQLRRSRAGESPALGSPSATAAGGGVTGGGVTGHGSPAPGRARQAPAVPPTGHRPPALPCGPDYPLLPAHRAS